jgi:Fe-S cluster biogenesis protein NfuA
VTEDIKELLADTSVDEEQRVRMLIGMISAQLSATDGGSIEFVALKEGTLEIKMGGACGGCPFATQTLNNVIEATVQKYFPNIKTVKAHTA